MKSLEFAKQAAKVGVQVELVYKAVEDQFVYRLHGFSRSGTCDLVETPEGVVAKTRYGTEEYIQDFDDLVFLAFSWYYRTARGNSYPPPDGWVDEFSRLGLIDQVVEKRWVVP